MSSLSFVHVSTVQDDQGRSSNRHRARIHCPRNRPTADLRLASSHARLSTATHLYSLYVNTSPSSLHIPTTSSSHVTCSCGSHNSVAACCIDCLGSLACRLLACLGSGFNGRSIAVPPYTSTSTQSYSTFSAPIHPQALPRSISLPPAITRDYYERAIPFITQQSNSQILYLLKSQHLRLKRSSNIPILDTHCQSRYWQ